MVVIVPIKEEYLWGPYLSGTAEVVSTLYLCDDEAVQYWKYDVATTMAGGLPNGSVIIDQSLGVSNFFVSVQDISIAAD